MSFTERYAPPKPPRWRRVFSVETAQSVVTFVVAVGLDRRHRLPDLDLDRAQRASGRSAGPLERDGRRAAQRQLGVIELTSADGTQLSAWSTPSKAKKSTTAVILVHDAGGDAADLERLAAALRAEHDVLTLDLRGHGASADAATTLGPAEAEDVRAAIEAVVDQGDERDRAGRRRPRCRRRCWPPPAATHASMASWPSPLAARGRRRLGPASRRTTCALAWPADWATLVAMLFRTGRDVTSADVMDTVTRTTAPILVVAGTDDPLAAGRYTAHAGEPGARSDDLAVEGDRDDAMAIVTDDAGIDRILDFVDAAFKRDD